MEVMMYREKSATLGLNTACDSQRMVNLLSHNVGTTSPFRTPNLVMVRLCPDLIRSDGVTPSVVTLGVNCQDFLEFAAYHSLCDWLRSNMRSIPDANYRGYR